jgi:DNA-binding PadR family transcriptional regulator
MFMRRFRKFAGHRHGREHWADEGGPHGPEGWRDGHGHGRRRGGPWSEEGGPFDGGRGVRFAPGGDWGWGGGPPQDDDDSFDRGGRGRGRQRGRRGDIKIVLLALVAEKPRHGYELIKELEQRYAGFYRPSPGSVYPTLQLLEDEGLLTSVVEGGKRIYTITAAGQEQVAAQGNAAAGPMGGQRGRGEKGHEGRFALRQRIMALMGGVHQVARHGTPEQVREVQNVIESATQRVYAILAGVRPEDAPEERDS